ncbi:putative signal transducing protein [Chryseobacterium sp. CT-SW4]|uniref:putative signal transducing protein n=1 Tax=Chryseobacterium sp. SW-1 TaxID=3157343 RepID=UPI003B012A0F
MSDLIRIKYCENAIEANRDKQILEENGIQSFIANEQLIQSDWLLSQAVGGIQLQVFEDDLEKAKEVLENYKENEEYSLEVEHTIPNPEFDFVCPKCGSNHIYQDEKPGGLFGISWLFLGFPLKIPANIYHCYYCGNEFKH